MIWGSSGVKLLTIESYFIPITLEKFYETNHNPIAFVGVDILRAGTTLCYALHNGAKEVIPVVDSNDAMLIYNRMDRESVLLGGERNCKKIEGYHLGNSPLEYTLEKVYWKSIILNTSNGSALFKMGLGLKNFLIGSFINISSICDFILQRIKKDENNKVILFCSGNNSAFSFEDAIFCGCLVDLLIQKLKGKENIKMNDATIAAIQLYNIHKNNLLEFTKSTEHGRFLIEQGFEKDIDFSLQSDLVPVVPISNGFSFVIYK